MTPSDERHCTELAPRCGALMNRALSWSIHPIALLLFLVPAACTIPAVGAPAPASAPPIGGTTSALPPRARDLPLARIDPCRLLTADQQASLGVSDPSRGTSPEEGDVPSCQWDRLLSEPRDAYLARLFIARGAAWALDSATGASVTEVAGFPTVRTTGPRGLPERHCFLYVDVAEEQTLFVGYQYEGRTEPMTTDLACDKARTAAELMLETLETLVE